MKVDKRNGKVLYNDEFHKYWIDGTDLNCISVTTLIHKFTQPFDEDFWSSYKALEKILDENFKQIKSELLSVKEFKIELLERFQIDKTLFDVTKNEILKEWETKRNESCIRGTKIHAEHEYGHYGNNTPEIQKLGLGGKFYCEKDYYDLSVERGIFPEYLISYIDEEFRLAGQLDLIIKDGNDIYVIDYKSNKKLDTKSYFNTKSKKHTCMLYPLNDLMDCNMVHYQMQLSTYAWMLQKINPNFIIKKLLIIHFDHDGNEAEYELEYIPNSVEKMVNYHKKLLYLEQQKEKRKPIIF